MYIWIVPVKNALLLGPNSTASSPFSGANFSKLISRSSYVLVVSSSRAWLSFLAVSLSPAARLGEMILPISFSFPQLFIWRRMFGLRPWKFFFAFRGIGQGKRRYADSVNEWNRGLSYELYDDVAKHNLDWFIFAGFLQARAGFPAASYHNNNPSL